jgi:uncharacterized membrane-anchored protein YhcB (DUF1043 family)
LIKIVPFWGLCLIGTSVAFIVPLIYTSNQELIDQYVRRASTVVNQQTEQIKQVATHHASVAAETTKQMATDYTHKAQEMVGAASAKTQELAGTAKDKTMQTAAAARDQTIQTANVAKDKTMQTAAAARDQTVQTANVAKDMTMDTAASARNQVNQAANNPPITTTTNTLPHAENTDPSFNSANSAAYRSSDFPAAPKQDFMATGPSVGSTASTLRDEREPLIPA